MRRFISDDSETEMPLLLYSVKATPVFMAEEDAAI